MNVETEVLLLDNANGLRENRASRVFLMRELLLERVAVASAIPHLYLQTNL